MTRTIALATCSLFPELDADERLLLEPLRRRGVQPTIAVWDDNSISWAAFDLVAIRCTWDYTSRRDAFVDWARSVPRLVNPADVVEWNTDKHYLQDLATAEVPVVTTSWIAPGETVALPPNGRHVLKPSVGAASIDAAAFSLDEARERERAREHAERLLAAGRAVMVQPYLEAIERHGETALMYVGGEFSHAVRKSAMLAGEHELVGGLYLSEEISPRAPTDAQLEVGRSALAAVPGGPERLAYARVDLVPDNRGQPLVIELELTEPSLFLAAATGAAERFADVLAALVH
jgi:glutathione synthase/RimK-type ligase-like ATP-grasp enzyme